MSRFKCVNKECPVFEKEIVIGRTSWILDPVKKVMVPRNRITCVECGGEMEYVKEEGEISVNFLQFDSLSSSEKKEMIHKRSVEHFKKKDKGDLERLKQRIKDDNRIRL